MILVNDSSKQFLKKAAFFCAISSMVFIPISTALMNFFLFLTLIFSIFGGDLKKSLFLIWKNPISRSSLLLFSFLSLSLLWTITDIETGLIVLKKYNELWYLALILPLFNSIRRRDIGIKAYLLSMGFILVGVYLIYFEIITPLEWTNYGHPQSFTVDGGFASHVITNILMAYAMYISAHKSIFSKSFWRLPYLIFFIFSFYYVLLISTGTSGQILAIVLLLLLIIQHTGLRALFIVPLLLFFIAILGYNSQTNSLRFAIEKLSVRYHHLISTDTAGNSTRPRIYIHSAKLLYHDKWFGSGVGSYEKKFQTYEPEFFEVVTMARKNPHNEYLMISNQLGILGLMLLIYIFYKQAVSIQMIGNKEQEYLAQGLVILIVIGCMGNSMILDSREGYFWAFFSALLFSNLDKKNISS